MRPLLESIPKVAGNRLVILPVNQWVYRVGHWVCIAANIQESVELVLDVRGFRCIVPTADAYLVRRPEDQCCCASQLDLEKVCDFVCQHWQRLQWPYVYIRVSRRANEPETTLSLATLIHGELPAIRFCVAHGGTEISHPASGKVIDVSKLAGSFQTGVVLGWVDANERARIKERRLELREANLGRGRSDADSLHQMGEADSDSRDSVRLSSQRRGGGSGRVAPKGATLHSSGTTETGLMGRRVKRRATSNDNAGPNP